MKPWIYLFSRFTSEALLFELLIIFLLVCLYSAFWILRKRRYGVIDTTIPSGPVKTYLNELILNAQQLRIQLFGLLSDTGEISHQLHRMTPASAEPDERLTSKLSELEAQLADQIKSADVAEAERTRLEHELAQARAEVDSKKMVQGEINKDTQYTINQLQQKVHGLENKLLEYSIIEDDLANLKRFQQENSKLKALLIEKKIQIPASILQAAPNPHLLPTAGGPDGATEIPIAIPTTSELTAAPPADFATAPTPEEDTQAPPPPPDDTTPPPPVPEEPESEPASAAPTSAAPAPASDSSAAMMTDVASSFFGEKPKSGSSIPTPPGQEEDLLSEFEKMLKQ